ncbi:hypothetical protein NLI96_g9598 [Meripilus lineatus]|uniref:Uncharacterized protein n=1 Tax=Meripilus lineatus TaxID=2056292 RepID=A0AAD5UWQ3_9APHY|nr:hypothetical protein NLI96_g9598 [Physisporinus lineatus]
MGAPGNIANVPALVPSSLGVPSSNLNRHRKHLSLSSSSNSSVSALSDEDLPSDPLAHRDPDNRHNIDILGNPASLRSAASTLGQLLRPNSGLYYARRPSATNHHSIMPILHRRTSSNSGTPSTPATVPSPPPHTTSASTEDDVSDTPSVSLSSSSSLRSRGDHFDRTHPEDIPHEVYEREQGTLSPKPKRNRASLPAYFSLLQMSPGSPPSSFHSKRSPSSIQTLTAISRSLHSSPSTPWSAQPVVDLTHAYAQALAKPATVEVTPRSRGRKRDPDRRSASSRRSEQRSPPRPLPSDLEHKESPRSHKDTIGASVRARLDSLEKVMGWVSSSPVLCGRGRTVTRRNSSPQPHPKYEAVVGTGGAFATVADLYSNSLQHAIVDDEVDDYLFNEKQGEPEIRGRRRVNELDEAPKGVDCRTAPGFGNGRSGLKSREVQRERGRRTRLH